MLNTIFKISLLSTATLLTLGLSEKQAHAAFFQGLGGGFDSEAYGVSEDGSVVVGYSSDSANGVEAFRWTQSGGMVGLGDLPGGDFDSRAFGVSGDGSVVVGYSISANGVEAFRWTQSGGMVGLGDLPGGGFYSIASGVSGDGSVVVGWSFSDNGYEAAFIWNSTQGMRSLKDVLTNDYGLNLDGWSLGSASAISADGLTIVGNGYNPNGQREAWIARLDSQPVPEPLTILGSATALGFGAFFKRQQAKKLQKKKNAN